MKRSEELGLTAPNIKNTIDLIMETVRLNNVSEVLLLSSMATIMLSFFKEHGTQEEFGEFLRQLEKMWKKYD